MKTKNILLKFIAPSLLAVFALGTVACSSSTLVTLLNGAQAAVDILAASGVIPPIVAAWAAPVAASVSSAATELQSTDSAVVKSTKILQTLKIQTPNFPGAPKDVQLKANAVYDAVQAFLNALTPTPVQAHALLMRPQSLRNAVLTVTSTDMRTLNSIKSKADKDTLIFIHAK